MKKIFAAVVVCFGLAGCSEPIDHLNPAHVIRGKNSIGILANDLGDCKVYDVYNLTYGTNGTPMRQAGRSTQITICRGQGSPVTTEYRLGKGSMRNNTIFEDGETPR